MGSIPLSGSEVFFDPHFHYSQHYFTNNLFLVQALMFFKREIYASANEEHKYRYYYSLYVASELEEVRYRYIPVVICLRFSDIRFLLWDVPFVIRIP